MSKAENVNPQSPYEESRQFADTDQIITNVMSFLRLFMCETLAKRIVSMILISVGLSNNRVTEFTGYCDKSVRTLRKSLQTGEISVLFHVGGGGQQGKLVDVEQAVIEEVNKNHYHSRQQIADMVHEKFGIKVSPSTIKRLLKKTALSG